MNGEHQSDKQMLRQIQDILLKEERQELLQLRRQLEDRDMAVQDMIDEKLKYFQTHFPLEFERSLNKVIDRRISGAQDEILDAIYPVLGKMIRKFVALQFEQLQDKIDQQLNKGIIGRLRNLFSGVRESEMIMSKMPINGVEEVFVIQKLSGLLIGSASAQKTVDRDVVAGMLTAIKGFVEDAFTRENEELEMIQYGSYSIIIQNFHSYYLAVAIHGTLNVQQKSELYNKILELGEQQLNQLVNHPTLDTHLKIKQKLKEYFFPQLVAVT